MRDFFCIQESGTLSRGKRMTHPQEIVREMEDACKRVREERTAGFLAEMFLERRLRKIPQPRNPGKNQSIGSGRLKKRIAFSLAILRNTVSEIFFSPRHFKRRSIVLNGIEAKQMSVPKKRRS